MLNIIARAMSATGHHATAAILLYRINYWIRFAKIERNGTLWIAKAAQDWCAETGLTPKQYETAIAHLRKRGLVLTEQHLFGGKNISHVQLTEKWTTMGDPTEGVPDDPLQGAPEYPQTGELYIKGDTKWEIHNGHTSALPTYDEVTPYPLEEISEQIEEDQVMPKVTHTMQDIVDGLLAPKSKSKTSSKAKQVAEEFRDRYSEVTGKFFPSFTIAQVAQIKKYVKDGPTGFDPVKNVRDVVVDWDGFIARVKDEKKVQGPFEPSWPFLYFHRGVAYNFTKTTGVPVKLSKDDDTLGGFKKFKAPK